MGWWTNLKRTGVGQMYSNTGDYIHRATGNLVDNFTGESQADAAENAARKQAAAGQEANSVLKDYLAQVRADQQPFYEMGLKNAQALNQAQAAGEFDNPALDVKFNYQDPGQFQFQSFDPSQVTNDPGYQLAMREGQDGVMNSAAARGSLRSGGTLKALARFNQGLASQKIGEAYDRYANERNYAMQNFNNNRAFGYGRAQDEYSRGMDAYRTGIDARANRFNRLAQLAGYGQGAAAANQQAGGAYAQGVGNNLMGIANAQGAAGVYGANARAQGMNNLLNLGVRGGAAAFGGG